MAKKFSELRDKMSPERQAKVAERTKEMLADMEENKVAQKLAQVVHDAQGFKGQQCLAEMGSNCRNIADAILQSPDLRVTIREPRYYVDPDYDTQNSRLVVRDRDARPGGWAALAYFNSEKHAREYAEFLNSKEPK